MVNLEINFLKYFTPTVYDFFFFFLKLRISNSTNQTAYFLYTLKLLNRYLPFVNSTFSQPTPTATLRIAPKLPGSLTWSQIKLIGNGCDNILTFSGVGVSKIPEILL